MVDFLLRVFGKEVDQRIRLKARIQRETIEAESEAYEKQKRAFDKRAKDKEFQVGDVVYVTRPHKGTQFQKFQPKFDGPMQVLRVRENDNLLLVREDGKEISVHFNRVKAAPFIRQFVQTEADVEFEPQGTENQAEEAAPNLDDGSGDVMIPADVAQGQDGGLLDPISPERSTPTVSFNPRVRERTFSRGEGTPTREPSTRWKRVRQRITDFADQAAQAISPGKRMTRSKAKTSGVTIPSLFPHGRRGTH